MSSEQTEFWNRARRARNKLADQFLSHAEVSLIDIGYDLEAEGKAESKEIVLRVHVRQPATKETLGLPAEIDNIPVRVIVADYRLE